MDVMNRYLRLFLKAGIMPGGALSRTRNAEITPVVYETLYQG
jgi:hypothetical protein